MGIASDAIRDATREITKRLDYELRGAWRAGYDYVHVYADPPGFRRHTDLSEQFAVTQYILPSNQEQPPRPETRQYRYTYDLASVPDERIRAAITEGLTHD